MPLLIDHIHKRSMPCELSLILESARGSEGFGTTGRNLNVNHENNDPFSKITQKIECNNGMDSLIYFFIKIPRIVRMFESSIQINEFLNIIGDKMTVFELKSIENKLNIIQFSVQTICTIHLLTCS